MKIHINIWKHLIQPYLSFFELQHLRATCKHFYTNLQPTQLPHMLHKYLNKEKLHAYRFIKKLVIQVNSPVDLSGMFLEDLIISTACDFKYPLTLKRLEVCGVNKSYSDLKLNYFSGLTTTRDFSHMPLTCLKVCNIFEMQLPDTLQELHIITQKQEFTLQLPEHVFREPQNCKLYLLVSPEVSRNCIPTYTHGLSFYYSNTLNHPLTDIEDISLYFLNTANSYLEKIPTTIRHLILDDDDIDISQLELETLEFAEDHWSMPPSTVKNLTVNNCHLPDLSHLQLSKLSMSGCEYDKLPSTIENLNISRISKIEIPPVSKLTSTYRCTYKVPATVTRLHADCLCCEIPHVRHLRCDVLRYLHPQLRTLTFDKQGAYTDITDIDLQKLYIKKRLREPLKISTSVKNIRYKGKITYFGLPYVILT